MHSEGPPGPLRANPAAEKAWNTHTHTGLVLCCLLVWPACPLEAQVLLAVPSGPGLSCLGFGLEDPALKGT